jgi:hypothetical protein
VDCGERFAERRERPARTSLAFLPGWVRPRGEGWSDEGVPGGVWIMSKRVRDRVAAGRAPVYRRDPSPAFAFGDEQEGRSRKRPTGGGTIPTVFPLIIVCPGCGLRQAADEQALGLRTYAS